MVNLLNLRKHIVVKLQKKFTASIQPSTVAQPTKFNECLAQRIYKA